MRAMLLAWKSIEIEVILAELYKKRDIEKANFTFSKGITKYTYRRSYGLRLNWRHLLFEPRIFLTFI